MGESRLRSPLLAVALLVLGGGIQVPTTKIDPSWRPAESAPTVEAVRVDTEILREGRRVFVALPDSHGATRREYPLVLVFDGESLLWPVLGAVEALTGAGHMPESVVVAVENTDRVRDLSPPGIAVSGNDGAGEADRFLRFLLEELRPALGERYRAGGPVTLVGHSSGGLFVSWAAAMAPGVVDRVLALDAPMHLGDGAAVEPLVRRVGSGGPALRMVSHEARFGWRQEDWETLAGEAPGDWLLERVVMAGETHGSMVWPSLYPGLRSLFADYSTVASSSVAPSERLRSFDEREPMGGEVPPPAPLLRQVVEDEIVEADGEGASRALERLEEGYGAAPATQVLRGMIADIAGRVLDGPTLEELLATPIAEPESAGELVGRWEGHSWTVGQERRTPLALEVRIEHGEVTGRFEFGGGPPHEIEYLLVEGEEFKVGYQNRMRPRGMLLYEGTIEGDVFAGQFVLRGVDFRMPDGRDLPEMRFRLERSGS